MLSHITQHDLVPSGDVFFALLKACHKRKALTHVNRLQALMALHRLETSSFLGDYLVSTLASCGGPADALQSFRRLPHGSVYSWTSMISAYIDCGQCEDALHMYQCMRNEGVEPNAYTLVSLFKACGCIPNLQEGMRLHDDAQRKGFTSDGFVGSALVSMYGKCGCIAEAENVFSGLSERDSVSWNALLSAYVEQCDGEKALQVYSQMQEVDVSANKQTYLITLRACCAAAEEEAGVMLDGQFTKLAALEISRALHAEAEKKGFASDVFVGSTLVSMYGKCGSTGEAEKLFGLLSWHDVVSGSAMLSAYLEQGQAEKVLQLYRQMQDVDEQMLVVSLQACCILAGKEEPDGLSRKVVSLEIGRAIHADGRRRGFSLDIFVGSTLVNMYGKCGSIAEAENVFVGLTQRDVVLFNAMLAAYVEQGQGERALQLYRQMHEEGVSLNERTLVTVLQACCLLAEKEAAVVVEGCLTRVLASKIGQALHADARRKGFDSDVFVGNTLVSMYGTCWNITEAENIFGGLSKPDAVSWNAMLSAYMEQEQGEKVLQLYKKMQEKGATVDDTTLSYILQACCETGSMEICRHTHHMIVSAGYDGIFLLASTLIRAYTSCASMIDALTVFDELDSPDVVSWTSLIAGYAHEGDYKSSLLKFKQMQQAGVKPSGVSYLSILSACSHANLVDTGIKYFQSMTRDYGITPEIEHYNCMIDLLGRAGDFTRVKDMLLIMLVEPDLITWLCLLSACQKHGNVELGKQFFHCAVRLQPKHAAAYVLMSNIFTNAGLLDCAEEVDNLRLKEAAWKKPGRCWIELEQEVHSFVVGDHSHQMQERLDDLLQQKSAKLKGEGHIPYTESFSEWHWKQGKTVALV